MPPFGWGLLVGGLIGLVLTAIVAGLAHARNQRLQERTRRAERLAELGSLTGGLTHEIKNPLSTIQLNLQLLREDLMPESPTYSRLVSRLDTVAREVSRLRDILDDFLRYAGRIELDKKPTDVHRLLDDLVDFFSPQAQLQRVQLRVKPRARRKGRRRRRIRAAPGELARGELVESVESARGELVESADRSAR